MADAVKEHKFNAGDVIIKQGEEGDQFYILVDGEAEATLDSNKDKPVMHYKQGQYFGELALLRGDVRAANVTATTNCKCIGLDRKQKPHKNNQPDGTEVQDRNGYLRSK